MSVDGEAVLCQSVAFAFNQVETGNALSTHVIGRVVGKAVADFPVTDSIGQHKSRPALQTDTVDVHLVAVGWDRSAFPCSVDVIPIGTLGAIPTWNVGQTVLNHKVTKAIV